MLTRSRLASLNDTSAINETTKYAIWAIAAEVADLH